MAKYNHPSKDHTDQMEQLGALLAMGNVQVPWWTADKEAKGKDINSKYEAKSKAQHCTGLRML